MASAPTKQKARRPRRRHREFQDVPEADGTGNDDGSNPNPDFVSIGGVDTTNEGMNKNRKRKRGQESAGENKSTEAGGESSKAAGKPSKNKKKKEHRKPAKAGGEDDNDEEGGVVVRDAQKSNARFIVFVGNLPYDTTQESLSKHLAAVKPKSIRLATHKAGETAKTRSKFAEPPRAGACKGYAFVEFSDAGRMKTCLTLFHHSDFNGRKINVELTAGGGGKGEDRKEKVRVRNEKLNEERKKKFEEERKKKAEEARKRGEIVVEEKEEVDDGIHPDRRKRVKR